MTGIDTQTAVTSRADVTTEQSARYAKQLLSHPGRKLQFHTDGALLRFATREELTVAWTRPAGPTPRS